MFFCTTIASAAPPSGTGPKFPTLDVQLVARAKTSFEVAQISNRVSVASISPITAFDPALGNYRDLWTVAGPNADLILTSRRDLGATEQQIPIAIDILNEGPDNVNGVMVINILRAADPYNASDMLRSVKFLKITASQGTCSTPIWV